MTPSREYDIAMRAAQDEFERTMRAAQDEHMQGALSAWATYQEVIQRLDSEYADTYRVASLAYEQAKLEAAAKYWSKGGDVHD
jgi:hypothetical protein